MAKRKVDEVSVLLDDMTDRLSFGVAKTSGTPKRLSAPATHPLVNYSFRHHAILLDREGDGAAAGEADADAKSLLHFGDLSERIEMFKELFKAHLDHVIDKGERAREENTQQVTDERKRMDTIKDRIEQVKVEQKQLYNAVAAERQAESSAQSQLALLQASRTSFLQRISEAEAEREKLQAMLEQQRRQFDQRKVRLERQVRRNKPELVRFNEKLGCRVSAGHDNSARDRSVIKFTFTMVDPHNWTRECHFVIDASRSQYKIVQVKPALPEAQIETLLAELNSSRALFTFIKRMRAAFKQQIAQEGRSDNLRFT